MNFRYDMPRVRVRRFALTTALMVLLSGLCTQCFAMASFAAEPVPDCHESAGMPDATDVDCDNCDKEALIPAGLTSATDITPASAIEAGECVVHLSMRVCAVAPARDPPRSHVTPLRLADRLLN